ncbi:alpha/beta hydrolase [Svornostia abyssi]|uniref:Alpha/beta hydrolase n=1 Tax=Svornostia abyssi TaxID=2898438 RepID=A0ABY5PAR8_9ACTN|nr:alpha/beta hydrolase [Parviterribacteraceae bacterium J379]
MAASRRSGSPRSPSVSTPPGYACLVFDYRYFGASGGEPRELLSVRRQLEDWRAAVSYARTVEGVDPARVVLWGTSFAGGHVIRTAADDPRIAAAIAQCPFTDGIASAAALDPVASLRMAPRVVRDLVAALRDRPPVRVPAYGDPGEVALMTAPDVAPGVRALIASAGIEEPPHHVPARIALEIPRYRPGRRAKDVRCPILFCVCDRDTVAPARATLRHARRAPQAEIRRYDHGHFTIYSGDAFEEVVADQLAFLAAKVPLGN